MNKYIEKLFGDARTTGFRIYCIFLATIFTALTYMALKALFAVGFGFYFAQYNRYPDALVILAQSKPFVLILSWVVTLVVFFKTVPFRDKKQKPLYLSDDAIEAQRKNDREVPIENYQETRSKTGEENNYRQMPDIVDNPVEINNPQEVVKMEKQIISPKEDENRVSMDKVAEVIQIEAEKKSVPQVEFETYEPKEVEDGER
jgi:hypothetical protein